MWRNLKPIHIRLTQRQRAEDVTIRRHFLQPAAFHNGHLQLTHRQLLAVKVQGLRSDARFRLGEERLEAHFVVGQRVLLPDRAPNLGSRRNENVNRVAEAPFLSAELNRLTRCLVDRESPVVALAQPLFDQAFTPVGYAQSANAPLVDQASTSVG